MGARYIIRFDDITPSMNWGNFLRIKNVLEHYKIKCILGVIPENRDKSLVLHSNVSQDEFIKLIKRYKAFGDTISQHGTYHIMDSKDGGYMRLNNYGEFAGHSYEKQLEKLRIGKEILLKNDIWEPYFMAPAHSFDHLTLKALKALNFKALTDGYGFWPYKLDDLILVPQLFASPIEKIKIGVQTICLHTNNMNDNAISNLVLFIEANHEKFIDFKEQIRKPVKNRVCDRFYRLITRYGLKIIRTIRTIV